MPKFIGNSAPTGAHQLADDARPKNMVALSYSQMKLLPGDHVHYSLNTSDRGSRGTLAKRWYNWFAEIDFVLANEQATPKMKAAAARKQQFQSARTV